MHSKSTEILVGFFVCLSMAGLLFLALHVSNFNQLSEKSSYTVFAYFENASGLKTKAMVSIAGVPIGRVSQIDFDHKNYNARVQLRIDARYKMLPTDTSASILTAGLLGEKYIGLSAGGLDDYLQEGDTIELTQSAVVLEQLISQFLFNSKDK